MKSGPDRDVRPHGSIWNQPVRQVLFDFEGREAILAFPGCRAHSRRLARALAAERSAGTGQLDLREASMNFSAPRVKLDITWCTGRPAACRRRGLHAVRPRVRGRLVMEGSRSTRVSAMRTSRRAVAAHLPISGERIRDTTRRTEMRGIPSMLRCQQ